MIKNIQVEEIKNNIKAKGWSFVSKDIDLIHHKFEDEVNPEYFYFQRKDDLCSQGFDTIGEAVEAFNNNWLAYS